MPDPLQGLPADVQKALTLFADAVRDAFAADLVSLVLFGTAAEGRLRATSDVNLIVVLRRFDRECAAKLGPAYRLASAAVRLSCMFLLESEVATSAEAFAAKFADIQSRHRVLYGTDPFASLNVPRAAIVQRTVQMLSGLELRLRERFILLEDRAERLAHLAAETAGPLRSSAATIAALEGKPAAPREALRALTAMYGETAWIQAVEALSKVREGELLPEGAAASTVAALFGLVERMRRHAESL